MGQILKNELRKVAASPLILGLLILFVAYNGLILWNQRYMSAGLQIISHIAQDMGTHLDQGMLTALQGKYSQGMESLNQLALDQGMETGNSLEAFLSVNGRDLRKIGEGGLAIVRELSTIETIDLAAQEIDSFYGKLDLAQVAEEQIKQYGFSGKAAEVVRNQYQLVSERLEELIQQQEHRALFFPGIIYGTHSLLFKTIYRSLIVEGMLLTVLITGYLMNYEYENGTHLLTYSSKRGRKLNLDKLKGCFLSAAVITAILVGLTLFGYFSVFSYQGLWQVPLGSYLNREFPLPNIPWWPLPFWQYLILTLGILYTCQMIFTAIAYGITVWVKSSYWVFFIFLCLGGLFLLLPNWMPRDGWAIFIVVFTPFTLVFTPNKWLMESGPFTSFQYYEALTLGGWAAISSLMILWGRRKFAREDIL